MHYGHWFECQLLNLLGCFQLSSLRLFLSRQHGTVQVLGPLTQSWGAQMEFQPPDFWLGCSYLELNQRMEGFLFPYCSHNPLLILSMYCHRSALQKKSSKKCKNSSYVSYNLSVMLKCNKKV